MKPLHFFKGLSTLVVLNLLIKPFWIFAIDRQVQNAVGFQQYGHYFSLLNLSVVASFVADAGLTNMVNRQLAITASNSIINGFQLIRTKLLLLIIYSSVVSLIALLTHVSDWSLLLPVIYIQAVTSLFTFLRGMITAHQLFKTDAWLSVLDKTLMSIVCGFFIFTPFLFGRVTLPRFLYSQMSCTTLAVGVAIVILYRKKLLPVTATTMPVRKIFTGVLPFALIVVLMSTHNRIDAFLLERMHRNGAYEAGVYAAAYRLLDAGNMVGYLAASFLVPYISRNKMDRSLIKQTVFILQAVLLFIGIVTAAGTVLLAPQLQTLLYHTSLPYITLVLQLTIAVLPAYYSMHIYSSVLTAMGNLQSLIKVLAGCVVINIGLNLIFIPIYGALACTAAALISQYVGAVGVFFLAKKSL